MKKFTKILICLMLCVFGFGLVACKDPRTEAEKNFTYPSSKDSIYGNGGLAVRKGNYVYFVNGYKSIEDVSKKKAKHTVGALMLMKLDENGNVVTKDGLLDDDYYITMSKKLCGYEATNLFISGNYLYFATPCLENESGDKVWAKERVTLNRIKLDKSSEVEEVYASGVKVENFQYQYYEADKKLYVLAWEKGASYYNENGNDALIRVDVSSKSKKIVSKDVQDVVFADNYNEIFFTKHNNNDDYYYLKQYDISTNTKTNYYSSEETFDIVDVQAGNVFISSSHEFGSSTDIMSSNISSKSAFELVHAYSSADSVNITPDGNVVLVSTNTITVVKDLDDVVKITDENATSIKIVDYTNGNILYYDKTDDGSNIKLVSYANAIAGNEHEIQTLTTILAVQEDCAYFDLNEEENMLYFYTIGGKNETNYYLHRLQVNNNMGEVDEMFGVYASDDEPEQEEEEEVVEEE